MKLSELKPCAFCNGPLLRPPVGNWYVIRVTTAMLRPGVARQTMGMIDVMGGSVRLGELFSPGADNAVVIIGDEPTASWAEVHVCLDCYCEKLGHLAGAVENADRKTKGDGAQMSQRK